MIPTLIKLVIALATSADCSALLAEAFPDNSPTDFVTLSCTSESVVAREGWNGPVFSVDTAGTISEMTRDGRWIILAD